MTSVVKIQKTAEPVKKPQPKPRVEPLTVIQIVESWKILEREMKDGLVPFPDLSEDRPEAIRSGLYNHMSSPNFVGFVLKLGRKIVGELRGEVIRRGVGTPKVFVEVTNLWVDPDARKKGYSKLLIEAFFAKLKASGVHHWEASVSEDVAKLLTEKSQAKRLAVRVGGKI